ncbi:MAG: T9SS type A sorting domain-containing protein [Sphingobacteriales bacterium]|nr:MAG: T9SS type A sorting domain-containing protein [Sphingobacteriales bacterium]
MNKILTLSLALAAITTGAIARKNDNNPFANKAGKQIHNNNVAGKTNANASRLLSSGTNIYDGNSYLLSDSSRYFYSGTRGFYNSLWEDWDYDTAKFMHFTSGAFRPTDRSYNQYNTTNKPTLMANEASDGSNWLPEDRTNITYDASGNVATYEYESNSGSGLANEYRVNASYDGSNKLISATEQEWDALNTIYQDAYRTTYSYNTNGDVLEEQYENFNGTSWDLTSRASYTYDANFNNTEILQENYNTGNWTPTYRSTNMFDPNNDLIKSMSEVYTSGNWQQTDESYFTYDGRHNAVTSEYRGYNGTAIIPSSYSTMTFNSYNQMLTLVSKSWDAAANQFELKQGDADMRWHYEEFPVGVNEVARQAKATFTVFPVPAANFVNISMNLEKPQGVFIVLQDISGKVLKTWNEAANKQFNKKLNTESIAPGNYIIKVMAGGEQYTQQVNIVK